jgi:ubiquinone/menaquinone biosynthesis C-methylase UbiE
MAHMARISYDDRTAAAYQAVREIPRAGLSQWREAVRRHLRPTRGMTLVDIGAGTGMFATAFADWFDLDVVAVEPSAAMRARIATHERLRVLDGDASAIPLPDGSADAAWLSLMIHHVQDLEAAAREIRRVLRPGAVVLFRQGFAGRLDPTRTFPWEFFPETARSTGTFPSLERVCQAFATVGFHQDALEPVPEALMSLAEFLDRVDTFRSADTNMRTLTDEEYQRGKEQLRRAVQDAGDTASQAARSNWLDLLVLR